MTLWRLARATRQAAQLSSATRNPARYAKNRAVSKGLGVLGLWRMMRRLYRWRSGTQ